MSMAHQIVSSVVGCENALTAIALTAVDAAIPTGSAPVRIEWQQRPDLRALGDLEAIVRPIASAACDLDRRNLTDAYIAMQRGLSRNPGGRVLVVGGCESLGLFAADHVYEPNIKPVIVRPRLYSDQ
jgi:hypothetical protein